MDVSSEEGVKLLAQSAAKMKDILTQFQTQWEEPTYA
jgi:hypothetical protein